MDNKLPLLAAVLAIQLLLIAGLAVWRDDAGATSGGPLLQFDRASIDAIRITDDEQSAQLQRSTDGWQIGIDGTTLPADDAKIAGVLDKLVDAGAPWPVATSTASARRFEVSADSFQRHVELFEGDLLSAELYLGTSPGFRKVHARRADDDSVYAITFSNYELPGASDDWLDKALLQPHGSIKSVSILGWTLHRDAEGWRLAQLAADRATHQERAGEVVEKVRNLRVLGVADEDVVDLEAAFSVTFEDQTDDHSLLFFQPEPDGEYLVTSSRWEGVFRVAMYAVEPLRIERAELIALAHAEPAEEGGEQLPADAPPG
jgi:hypothetical protein